MSYTYLNISNSSNYITDNISLISNLLKTFVKENIFLFTYLFSSSMNLPGFFFMPNHSITDYIVTYDLHKTPNSISKDFSLPRVITYFFQPSNSLNTSI